MSTNVGEIPGSMQIRIAEANRRARNRLAALKAQRVLRHEWPHVARDPRRLSWETEAQFNARIHSASDAVVLPHAYEKMLIGGRFRMVRTA